MGESRSSYCHLVPFLSIFPYLHTLSYTFVIRNKQSPAVYPNIWRPLCSKLENNLTMPPRRSNQRLHSDEVPPQEPTKHTSLNQPTNQILPTIDEGPEHPAFRHIPEVQLHQPTCASTSAAGPSQTNDVATSSHTGGRAPRQSLLRAPSPIHMLPGDAEFDQVQIGDWDEEAAAVEEEELARV
jgi:hypothetical protein